KIERDADGRATGILREWNAIELVRRHIPDPNEATLSKWLAEAIAEAHSLGITGIHDQRVENEGAQSFRLWQKLEKDGRLQLRVHMNIAAELLPEATALGLQSGFGSDRLWVGHVKAFADGTMGSHTAWMLASFTDEPGNTGLAVTPPTSLWDLAVRAAAAGYALSVHAIGDRAVREVLDVYAELAARSPRPAAMPPRIEHVQLIHPDDLGRLAELGVVASMQPVHLLTDWPTADKVWGDRARYTYAFRTLLDKGTPLALGSDAPVAPLNPMLSFYAALNRMGVDGRPAHGWYPQEKITLPEIIAGFTTGPAMLSHKQAVQGSITPGKWADMVIMKQNLFEMEPSQIHQVRAAMTIFNGEVVWKG
ncbi:MAG: amidohydrolase, partial [Anaerolineae bacterium]